MKVSPAPGGMIVVRWRRPVVCNSDSATRSECPRSATRRHLYVSHDTLAVFRETETCRRRTDIEIGNSADVDIEDDIDIGTSADVDIETDIKIDDRI